MNADLLRVLEELDSVPAEEIPGVLGRIEELKSRLWSRLVCPVPAAPAAPRAQIPATEPLLTVAQAAARFGVSKWWLYRHVREIPHVPLPGGGYRFSPARLERWLREREH